MSTIIRVIDTETTSFEGGVCELASIDIVGGKLCNPMSDFVKPSEPITVGAMAVHHITDAMVADAPPLSDVIDRYLGADFYVAHNAAFDRPKLPQITRRGSARSAGPQALSGAGKPFQPVFALSLHARC